VYRAEEVRQYREDRDGERFVLFLTYFIRDIGPCNDMNVQTRRGEIFVWNLCWNNWR